MAFVCFSLVLIFFSSASAKPLRIGIEHFPPFMTINEDGSYGGTALATTKQILKTLDISYTIDGFPPAREFEYIATGKTDLVFTVKKTNNKYAKTALFSKQPIMKITLMMYAMPESPPPGEQEAWINKRFIVIRGYNYGGFINNINAREKNGEITVQPVNSHKAAFMMLQAGRGDYVVDYQSPASAVIDELNMTIIQHTRLIDVDVHIVMNPKFPNAEQLLRDIEDLYGKR